MKRLLITSFVITCFGLTSFIQPGDKPIAEYKVGAAKVTVWENKRADGSTWKNFEIDKLYKKSDKWKTSNHFDERELLQLKEAIEQAIKGEDVQTK